VKSALLMVTEKLVLDGESDVAHCATAFSDHLVTIQREGVANLVEDDVVHPNPPRINGRSVIRDVLE
jgi:hypothetical protein